MCTEKYCMQACSKNKINSPIHIPAIQAAILEKARETGKEIKFRKPKFNGMSVAVVGAGAMQDYLRRPLWYRQVLKQMFLRKTKKPEECAA